MSIKPGCMHACTSHAYYAPCSTLCIAKDYPIGEIQATKVKFRELLEELLKSVKLCFKNNVWNSFSCRETDKEMRKNVSVINIICINDA